MMNERTYTLNLSRIHICDLLLACINAEFQFDAGSESAQKWARIHDELKEQLEAQDDAAFQQEAEETEEA